MKPLSSIRFSHPIHAFHLLPQQNHNKNDNNRAPILILSLKMLHRRTGIRLRLSSSVLCPNLYGILIRSKPF